MPLDTGGVTSLDLRNSGDRETNRASGLTPSLEVGPDIGAALKAAGADARYTEFPDANHNAWDPAYSQTPELWTWLFAQRTR